MGVRMYWEDAGKTVMCYDLEGAWTWTEFYAALNQVLPEWETLTHRTDTIVNLLNSAHIPPGAIGHVKSLADKQKPSSGMSILVTNNRLAHILYNTARTLYPSVARFFRMALSMREAHEMIHSEREEIGMA